MAKKKTPAETPESTTAAAPARRRAAAPKPKTSHTDERVQAGSDVVTVTAANDAATATAAPAPGNGDGNTEAIAAPSYEQISEAAYLRYLNRGGSHGQDFEDWIEAERSLRK